MPVDEQTTRTGSTGKYEPKSQDETEFQSTEDKSGVPPTVKQPILSLLTELLQLHLLHLLAARLMRVPTRLRRKLRQILSRQYWRTEQVVKLSSLSKGVMLSPFLLLTQQRDSWIPCTPRMSLPILTLHLSSGSGKTTLSVTKRHALLFRSFQHPR